VALAERTYACASGKLYGRRDDTTAERTPLRDRAARSGQPAWQAQPRRHCRVVGPAEDPGPSPGLVLEWRRDGSEWLALVVYVIAGDGHSTTVHTWGTHEGIRCHAADLQLHHRI
jgi:hypothetical protein